MILHSRFQYFIPLSQFQFRVYCSSLHRVNLNSSFSFYRAMLWYSAMFVCQSLSGCLPHSSIVSKWLYGSLRNRRCMESFSVSNDLFICSIVTADKYLYQKLDGKYTERVKLPAKAKFVFFANTWQHLPQVLGLLKVYKNSSGDEIANVNFLRRYGTYVLQNTKKENLLRLTN